MLKVLKFGREHFIDILSAVLHTSFLGNHGNTLSICAESPLRIKNVTVMVEFFE